MGTARDTAVLGATRAPAVPVLHPWWDVAPGLQSSTETPAESGKRILLPDLFVGRTAHTVEVAAALSREVDAQAALG